MPSVVRLRFLGTAPVLAVGLGREVQPDELCEVPGTVLSEWTAPGEKEPKPVPEDADYYLIETGNPPVVRAWPKSKWRNETPVSGKSKKE